MTLGDFLDLRFRSNHKITYKLNDVNISYYDLTRVDKSIEIEKIFLDIDREELDDKDIGINLINTVYDPETSYTVELPCNCFYYDVMFNIITKERR